MKTSKVTERIASLARKALVSAPAMMAVALAGNCQAADAKFENYTQTIPGGTVKFDMIAIPGGEITVGSPESEAGRDKADLAPKKVTVKSFWMGKCEVSWEEFLPYVFIDQGEVAKFESKIEGIIDKDGVSHPTKPYGSVYRERGEKGFPAIGMGWPAAQNYCKWLSKKTGKQFRLPTEEEWEYACRAGSTTPYFWGADAAQAKEFGWSKENANDTTHPIGKLKPNKFGLLDIVGNVAEWCAKSDPKTPGVIRGGAFTEPAAKMRSASRMIETDEWNEMDPQSPQSVWWLSAADFVGFRVVCDLDGAAASAAPAASAAETKPEAAQGKVSAKDNFTKQCKGCHGETGKGDTKLGKSKNARDYTTAAVKATFNADAWFKAVKEGLEKDGKHLMMAYKDKFSDDEIKALVEYMKNF